MSDRGSLSHSKNPSLDDFKLGPSDFKAGTSVPPTAGVPLPENLEKQLSASSLASSPADTQHALHQHAGQSNIGKSSRDVGEDIVTVWIVLAITYVEATLMQHVLPSHGTNHHHNCRL